MEIKTVKTSFLVSEFEEEQTWLEKMHRQGWKLIEILRNQYKFERCQPENWVYQLDFQKKDVEKNEYVKHFDDYGWNYILQHSNWFYFRRIKDVTEEDLSIFSNKESKNKMCERVLDGKLKVNVNLFFLACLIMILTVFTNTFTSTHSVLIPKVIWMNDFVKAALSWIGVSIMVATSFSFSDYKKIRDKINIIKYLLN